MIDDSKSHKLCHTIESRANSLREAAKLLRNMSPEERREIMSPMRGALKEIEQCLNELEKNDKN